MTNHKTRVLSFGICASVLFWYLFFGICHSSLYAQDKVIAIVNNDVITQKDLNDFVNFMRVQMSAEYKGAQLENKIESMKQGFLDRLIEDRLILQEAKNLKINVEESRVKAKIEEIRGRMGSEANFQESLKQQGFVQADLETKIREQLMMYTLIEIRVRRKVVVDPSEITDFYNSHKDDFKSAELREFDTVITEKETQAAQIIGRLKEGISMEKASEEFKAQLSPMGISKAEGLKKEIDAEIFGIKINEISKPLKIENKFYIFKLKKIIPERLQALDEVKDTIQTYLFEKKMQEELEKWLDELKKHSYIKIL